MKNKYFKIIFSIFLFLSFPTIAFCKLKEEKEEQLFDLSRLQKTLSLDDLSLRFSLYSGYDSNVNLSKIRKSDVFEEMLLLTKFSKKFTKNLTFSFNYNLDYINYNEFTDISNILNQFIISLQTRVGPFLFSKGYDLGVIYYPKNEEGDFLFHKAFFSLRQQLPEEFYQQLRFELGYKHYNNKKAYLDSFSTYTSDKRHDWRYTTRYIIGKNFKDNLSLRLDISYSINDSNVLYIDYYDYTTITPAFILDYKINKRLSMYSRFSYTKKDYKRTVTLRDYKQKDDLFVANLGLVYQLNKNNSINTSYTYRRNSSNDDLAEYFSHTISCGWQYRF